MHFWGATVLVLELQLNVGLGTRNILAGKIEGASHQDVGMDTQQNAENVRKVNS